MFVIEESSVQSLHLKTILDGKVVRALLYVTHATRKKRMQQIGHFKKNDSEQSESDPNNAEPDDFNSEEVSTDVPLFSLSCAARGFHEYRKFWAPTINQKLIVKPQTRNLFDPYAIGLFTKLRGKIEPLSLVGHLPREISRFSKFYLEYGGNMKASVGDVKFHRSPLPQGGLEIPITLTILQNNASITVYNKMQEFMMEY